MSMDRQQSLLQNDKVISPKNTSIACDYSRAAQVVCKPVEQTCGAFCSCAACLCTPIFCCVMICCSQENSREQADCRGVFSAGNTLGACGTRGLARLLGFILGCACYPCEKINRNTMEAKQKGNQHTLFCCPIKRETLESVNCRHKPDPSPCMEDRGPKDNVMQ